MAKKINPDIPANTEPVSAVPSEVPEPTSAPAMSPTPPPESRTPTDPYVLRVLRAYRSYPVLYVDSHGGAYTPDTPAALRQGATKYENPYYQTTNTQL